MPIIKCHANKTEILIFYVEALNGFVPNIPGNKKFHFLLYNCFLWFNLKTNAKLIIEENPISYFITRFRNSKCLNFTF